MILTVQPLHAHNPYSLNMSVKATFQSRCPSLEEQEKPINSLLIIPGCPSLSRWRLHQRLQQTCVLFGMAAGRSASSCRPQQGKKINYILAAPFSPSHTPRSSYHERRRMKTGRKNMPNKTEPAADSAIISSGMRPVPRHGRRC